MFNFLACIVAASISAYISMFSHSNFIVILLSAIILIPLFLLRTVFIRNEMKNMGNQLIDLKNTSDEEHSLLITLIPVIVGAVFFLVIEWPISVLWTPWLIVVALFLLHEVYASRYFKKGLMKNGVCTGHRFIKWGNVESFKWVRKSKDHSTLKIGTTRYYSYWIVYLYVVDVQKEEVDEIFKKRVGS